MKKEDSTCNDRTHNDDKVLRLETLAHKSISHTQHLANRTSCNQIQSFVCSLSMSY